MNLEISGQYRGQLLDALWQQWKEWDSEGEDGKVLASKTMEIIHIVTGA